MNDKQKAAIEYAIEWNILFYEARGYSKNEIKKNIAALKKGEGWMISRVCDIMEYEKDWNKEKSETLDKCIQRLKTIG